ncbi:unnamed protein product [Moneuplotes crassus]|uniref:B box-type domain-containing protein n=1 Tax=Euplotes crassus TaxID=5936 RepID=A0AAD1XAD8_EUPCR|nr:unnamed protein product [Moneuplotes crassus]
MDSDTERSQMFCKIHASEDIKAFCMNDLYSVCFKCLLEEHRDHEVVLLEDLHNSMGDLKDKVPSFHDKVDEQVHKLSHINDRVSSIKENYDKKFEGLLNKFKDIENKFLNGYFEDMVLGELKNSKEKQKEIVETVQGVLEKIEGIGKEIQNLRECPQDFFLFENIRNQIEQVYKELNIEERELKKLSCTIADYSEVDINDKFSELLQNTFILKKSYTSSKNVHYFEWGTKHIHFYEVEKQNSEKVTLSIDFNIPKFCRTVVTDEGRIFCIGGRHQDNVCCDWMLEYLDNEKSLVYRSPLLFRRSDFTALYSERGLIYVIGGNDAKSFYTACEKYDIQNDTWSRIADLNVARDSAASCIINNKYIYVFSGRTKFEKKEITDTIEMYDIDLNLWRMVNLNPSSTWIACDLAMCMPIDTKTILLFGGFDKTARTQDCFYFHIDSNLMEKTNSLPKVGSFSNYVFSFDGYLYVVGWNNTTKNLYSYNIAERTWKIETRFAI